MGRRAVPMILCLACLAIAPAPATAQEPSEVMTDFGSVLAVVDPVSPGFPASSLMRVECVFLVRTAAEDGGSEEWQACELSDEPVMIPENQGAPPEATLTYGGGACTWSSDYWFLQDESDVMASEFEVTVTPSGRVLVWSSYPAEPLVCEEA